MEAGTTAGAVDLPGSTGSAGAVGGSMGAGAIGAGALGVCAMAVPIDTMSMPRLRWILARVWAEIFMVTGATQHDVGQLSLLAAANFYAASKDKGELR